MLSFLCGRRYRLAPELGGAEVLLESYRGTVGAQAVFGVRIGGRDVLISENALRHPTIEWEPGDVVVIKYHPGAQPYTFVRGAETWPADLGREPKTDEQMNKLYAQGKVTPKLQAGGKPFDPARLPGGPVPVRPAAQGGVFHDDWLRG